MKNAFPARGFYSKMLLISILILVTVSIVLSSVVGYFAAENDRDEFLKNYDIVLNDLHRIFLAKHKNYYKAIEPLFGEQSHYNDLCALLKDYDSIDNIAKKDIVEMLEDICNRDPSSVGIMLYSKITDRVFIYDIKYQTINVVSQNAKYPDHTPFMISVMTDAEINSQNEYFANQGQSIYGLVGTISEHDAGELGVLGEIVVLYSTTELQNLINDYNLDNRCIFNITDLKGDLIFRSSGEENARAELIISRPEISTSDTAYFPASEQKTWFVSSIYCGRFDYLVSYQLEKSIVQTSFTKSLIILFALVICVFSISLYFLTFRIAESRVRKIQNGMLKIGDNNLTYRIPPVKGNDEFSQIITGFNRMCDELQKNVERSFVYELQQKKSELYALQTSINPHFLYNTLEMIRVSAQNSGNGNTSQMILLLSKIYRNQLNRNMYVTIEDELEQCENLIFLYQCRFENFDYDFSIPEELFHFGLPKNTLQPLIENYFVHGIDSNSENNFLSLTGEMFGSGEGKMIRLRLSNNGNSISEGELEALLQKLQTPVLESNKTHGFALTNVHSRLRIVFGEGCGVFPSSGDMGVGFKIDIIFPPVSTSALGSGFFTT